MRYTVVWAPQALGHLANLWRHAPDKQAVTDASDNMEIALRDDPDLKVKAFGKRFTYEHQPLRWLLEIHPLDRIVRILTVRRVP